MLAVSPVLFEGVLRNREIDECDEDTNHNFCPKVPLLVIVRKSNYVKNEPSNEAVYKQLKVFLSIHVSCLNSVALFLRLFVSRSCRIMTKLTG